MRGSLKDGDLCATISTIFQPDIQHKEIFLV